MPRAQAVQRHLLSSYLRVFNRVTRKPMGSIVELSQDGLVMASDLPVLVNARFDMYFKLPAGSQVQIIDITAVCRWTGEDVQQGMHDSGFLILSAAPEYSTLIDLLNAYFSFRALPASA